MDKFKNAPDELTAPAQDCFVVTPHPANAVANAAGDTVVLKGLRAAGAGTVTFRAIGSSQDVVHPVLDGERIDVRITHVRSVTGGVTLIGYA